MTMARRRVPSSGFRPTQESAPVGQYDWGLIALFLMLLCIGLLMVLSASGVVAERINGTSSWQVRCITRMLPG